MHTSRAYPTERHEQTEIVALSRHAECQQKQRSNAPTLHLVFYYIRASY